MGDTVKLFNKWVQDLYRPAAPDTSLNNHRNEHFEKDQVGKAAAVEHEVISTQGHKIACRNRQK
jgi:hypothetical protein